MSKKRGTKRKNEEEFDVDFIVDHRINVKTLQAQFRVRWEGFNADDDTWEPIDHLYQLPIVLSEFIDKQKKSLGDRLKGRIPSEVTENMSPFKPLDDAITRKLTDPEEVIPVGDEELANIQREVISGEGNFLWWVVFKHDNLPCCVRKSVISYYWPMHASMFLTRQVKMAEKLFGV